MNTLLEVQFVAKKKLCEFQPIVQTVNMQMYQVDATIDSGWNYLVASKPKGCIIDATQQFIAKASLLSRKWQDKIVSFQEVRRRSLALVPELGPLFEEAEKEEA
jgi:hypothetical protein